MATRYQFGIRRLLALTFGVALVMALVMRIVLPPEIHGLLLRWVLGGYLLVVVGWLVMRGPGLYARFVETRSRRHELKQRRSELEQEVAKLKRRSDIVKSEDDVNGR